MSAVPKAHESLLLILTRRRTADAAVATGTVEASSLGVTVPISVYGSC